MALPHPSSKQGVFSNAENQFHTIYTAHQTHPLPLDFKLSHHAKIYLFHPLHQSNHRLYSGLTLNQYGVASPCRTICTVFGFVALS